MGQPEAWRGEQPDHVTEQTDGALSSRRLSPPERRHPRGPRCGPFSPDSLTPSGHTRVKATQLGVQRPHGELVLFCLKHKLPSPRRESCPVGRRPPPRERPWNVRNVLEPPARAPGQERLGSSGPWGLFHREDLRAAGPPGSSYQTAPFGTGVRPQPPLSVPRFPVWL